MQRVKASQRTAVRKWICHITYYSILVRDIQRTSSSFPSCTLTHGWGQHFFYAALTKKWPRFRLLRLLTKKTTFGRICFWPSIYKNHNFGLYILWKEPCTKIVIYILSSSHSCYLYWSALESFIKCLRFCSNEEKSSLVGNVLYFSFCQASWRTYSKARQAQVVTEKLMLPKLIWNWWQWAMQLASITWKTFGADTMLARAEDRVAAMMPAVTRYPKPDTSFMACTPSWHLCEKLSECHTCQVLRF